jgi:membrane associated rhomboid family serine protease
VITRALILINVLAFVWEVIVGGPSVLTLNGGAGLQTVYERGALSPASVLQYHEYWRIVSSAFLHGGLLHIGLNMMSLWFLGRFIEAEAGSTRMLIIYMLSLVASGLGVVYLSGPDTATLGASGAIFGLFGALFAIGFKLGPRGMDLIKSNLGILVVNLIFTFSVPGISWQAHVSGLVAGFILTLVIYYPPRRIAPAVVDAATGEGLEAEYQAPHQ